MDLSGIVKGKKLNPPAPWWSGFAVGKRIGECQDRALAGRGSAVFTGDLFFAEFFIYLASNFALKN